MVKRAHQETAPQTSLVFSDEKSTSRNRTSKKRAHQETAPQTSLVFSDDHHHHQTSNSLSAGIHKWCLTSIYAQCHVEEHPFMAANSLMLYRTVRRAMLPGS
jgi:hypothetical protein